MSNFEISNIEIPFDLTFNFDALQTFFSQSPWVITWQIFIHGGWVIFIFPIFWIARELWVMRIQGKFLSKIHYTLLAIDVPRENLQGPKAVEQMFAHLSGAHTPPEFIEKYWEGLVQLGFSLEIVSIDGYIQFLIRTPSQYRDLVEAAIYAQYPDADITEVADYTENAPDNFPNEEYNLWGVEFVLYNNEAYPIRTYSAFSDLTKMEDSFKDPMASLLEIMGKLGKGEQLWLQFIITPTGLEWKEEAGKVVKKILGQEIKAKETKLDKALMMPVKFFESVGDVVFSHEPSAPEKAKESKSPANLSPGERKVVEAIQNKMSKIGFQTKFRMIYFGKKEVFSKARGVSGTIGAIKQFNTMDLNGFKPDSLTKTSHPKTFGEYFFFTKKQLAARQEKIMQAYRKRSNWMGAKSYVLNIEELATLYHFPDMAVKSPSVKKSEAKTAEPPFSLPIVEEEEAKEMMKGKPFNREDLLSEESGPPSNLPTAEE